MNIAINTHPISNNSSYNINFGIRADYLKYSERFNIRASNWFRRSQCYGVQSENFQHVINTLTDIYKAQNKVNLLVVGIGEGQEPLSMLTTIKALNKNKKLNEVVDLNCVDLQPKSLDENEWRILNFDKENTYFPEMFRTTQNDYHRYGYPLNEISDYYRGILNNPDKTKFDTSVIEFVRGGKKEMYDVISCNNTLIYGESKKENLQALRGLAKLVKPNGILITDNFKEFANILKDGFKELYPGIWQKI